MRSKRKKIKNEWKPLKQKNEPKIVKTEKRKGWFSEKINLGRMIKKKIEKLQINIRNKNIKMINTYCGQ